MNRLLSILIIAVTSLLILSFDLTKNDQIPTEISSDTSTVEVADKVLGKWVTRDKRLYVEVYKQGTTYSAKIIDYTCHCDEGKAYNYKKGVHKSNPSCINQKKWLGSKVMWSLVYNGEKTWTDGYIKDLKSGRVYSSTVRQSNNSLEVRGYYGIELFGQTLYFDKL